MPPGKRELLEELLQPGLILADVGIDLAVSAFEIRVANDGRAAVPGAGDVNHVEVVFLDDPVQVDVDEVLARRRAPVSQQHVLDVRERQRPLQQRIVVRDKSGRPTDSWRRASRRPSCGAVPE